MVSNAIRACVNVDCFMAMSSAGLVSPEPSWPSTPDFQGEIQSNVAILHIQDNPDVTAIAKTGILFLMLEYLFRYTEL